MNQDYLQSLLEIKYKPSNTTKLLRVVNLENPDSVYNTIGKLMEHKKDYVTIYQETKKQKTEYESIVYESYRQERSRILERLANKNFKLIESDYPCRACKSKKTYCYEIQTRSADEGATLFLACTECNTQTRLS